MKTCKEWIQQLMAERRCTPYRVAKLIGIEPSAVAAYLNGTRAFDNFTSYRLAELLGADVNAIIASAEAHRAKTAERRAYWERVMSGLAGVAVLSFVVLLASDSPALAYPADECVGAMCIMFNVAVASVYVIAQTLAYALLVLILASSAKPAYCRAS